MKKLLTKIYTYQNVEATELRLDFDDDTHFAVSFTKEDSKEKVRHKLISMGEDIGNFKSKEELRPFIFKSLI